MALTLAMGWILPLFHGEPKLAPIYNPVTHMVPPAFPLLLIVPAFGLDLLMHRFRNVSGWWRNTLLAALLSVLFALLFIGTQWKFSEFLLTPAADNWFFIGNRYWWYFSHPGDWMHEFWHDRNWPKDPLTPGKFALALGFAFLSTRLGLSFGAWMSRVKR